MSKYAVYPVSEPVTARRLNRYLAYAAAVYDATACNACLLCWLVLSGSAIDKENAQ
jgi:Pyruvate/2-oxoacid:ferredoxin oxidoreductase delta subunit